MLLAVPVRGAWGQEQTDDPSRTPSPAAGRIEGRVRDAGTGTPLAGAHVQLVGTAFGTATDARGAFRFAGIPPGHYALAAGMLGFAPAQHAVHLESAGQTVRLHIDLADTALALSEVVVTPGRFSMQRAAAGSVRSLTQDDLERLPTLGDDIYRAVRRMPGLSGSDFSARFNVRGGEHDEVLVTLDGLALQDPFHLKDIGGGALSIIDVEAIGGVDLMTGAFTAEYGNRLSGVFAIDSVDPPRDAGATSVGVSLMNARLRSQGSFRDGDGQWFVIGRRGYMDLLLELTGQDQHFAPRYYDVFGKASYRLDRRHRLSVQALASHDRLDFVERDEPDDRTTTSYGNAYLWSTLKSVWSRRLYGETIVSATFTDRSRRGIDIRRSDGRLAFRIDDERAFASYGVKQDWRYEAGEFALLKWGGDMQHHRAGYRYLSSDFLEVASARRAEPFYAEERLTRRLDGGYLGLYGSVRLRVSEALLAESGLRYDAATWSDDRHLSPRLNVSYQIDEATTVLAGMGRFRQIQGLHQLMLEDNDAAFYPAEQADHRVIGVSRSLSHWATLRVDAYHKRKTRIRPRYVSLVGDATDLFPEIGDDRVALRPHHGEAKGVEVLLQAEGGHVADGWISYSLAGAEDEIEGRRVPKAFDQRHTIYADANLNLPWRIGISLSWQYHTGWRYTALAVNVVRPPGGESYYDKHYGPLNGERLPAYHRLDVRVHRTFVMRQSLIAAYVEVRNAYNRQNVRLYNYLPENRDDGTVRLIPEPQTWLPIMPAFGLRWDVTY